VHPVSSRITRKCLPGYYYRRQIDYTFSQVGSTLRGDEDMFAPSKPLGPL
jgi:hypothetical protein